MADTNKNHIPQTGGKLKQLRQQLGIKQVQMAASLEGLLKGYMRPGFVVQQPDISKLELEETALDIPKLLAYAQVCNVDIGFLLKPHFQRLCRSEMRLQQFDTNEEADHYLCDREKNGRILIFSQFPAAYFVGNEDTCRYRQIAEVAYEEGHRYALDSLLNFIFSPVSHYSRQEKISILERYLQHFRRSPCKRLSFFSRRDFPSIAQFPNMELLQDKSTLIMLAPLMQQYGDVFLEIHNQQLCDRVFELFFHQIKPLDADVTLLKIALETLENMPPGLDMLMGVRFFYQEVLKRSPEDSQFIRENFSVDLQPLLV